MPATGKCSGYPRLPEALGLFGGTFDPVHLGHLRLAEEALEALGLAELRWLPAGQPPHRDTPAVSARQRLDMVRIATADNPRFSVDPAEVEAARASYTVLTLERLRAEIGPTRPLVLLLGADAFAGLPGWHRWQDIFGLAHVAVSQRPGSPLDSHQLPPALAAELAGRRGDAATLGQVPAGQITCFTMTQMAISATAIRQALGDSRSVRYLLPDGVVDYINRHHLYRNA